MDESTFSLKKQKLVTDFFKPEMIEKVRREKKFLPMTREEMDTLGWSEVDIVFVSGDAYVDHPSFAAPLLARCLEAAGFRVAILSQPDWRSCEDWKTFGRPRLAFCISAGNMDSMISNYTANRKVRNDDAYAPNGQSGRRPDRATLGYCQRAREAFPGVTVLTGGVEASLRRMAHYDFWSDKVKRSILMDSKADLLIYGMGEAPILEVISRLDAGEPISEIRDVRGTVYRLGASEDLPEEDQNTVYLPSCEEVTESADFFCKMTKTAYENLNPYSAARLLQEHALEAIVINPPSLPLSQEELDAVYGLPFLKMPHPSYGKAVIPAYDVIKTSVQILRGCFGGCAFCSLAAHQGKFIQSRSIDSVVAEIEQFAEKPDDTGVVSDIGGPTANMYNLGGKNRELCEVCRRTSCLHPAICENLETDHTKLIQLMRTVRNIKSVRQVFIASGVRTDLALQSPDYVKELVCHHIGGHLKTAPEHVDPNVLALMNKPPIENYDEFVMLFESICRKNHKDLYLVPYLIAGLPGSDIPSMIRVAEYLHKHNIRPQQVQDFIPGPFEQATCMYHTGMNPFTGERVHVAKGMRERRIQRALLQYFLPENYYDVKMALRDFAREDLIGAGPDCLIPSYPPRDRAMSQSSRVKRLQRKQEREKEARQAFREEKERENAENRRQKRSQARQNKDESSSERREPWKKKSTKRFSSPKPFTPGEKRSSKPFTPGEKRSSKPFTPGEKRSSKPFSSGTEKSSKSFTPGEKRSSKPFTPGEKRSSKPFSSGTERSSKPFTPGEKRSSKPFTPGEKRSSKPFSSGTERSSKPFTPGEKRSSKPFTPGNKNPKSFGGKRPDRKRPDDRRKG